jgi:KaiC/GvpD/RAD55 family RecA-like ATPase
MSSVAPLNELARALLRDNPHEVLLPYRDRLEWALDRLSDQVYQTVCLCALHYDRKYGRCPDSLQTLRSFILLNPDNVKELVHAEGTVIPEMDELAKENSSIPETEFLILATLEAGQVAYHQFTYQAAKLIAIGTQEWPKNSGNTGVDAARQYVRYRWEKDILVGGKMLDGGWLEHTPEISKMLDDQLDNPEQYRIYTGFKTIDENVVIGPKNQKWIGILGYTNHGKTAFLLSLIYNMARAGHRVLLVPREYSPEEAWLRLTFMHSEHIQHGDMGSLDDWMLRPGSVTPEMRAAKDKVLEDLQNRVTIKGGIDVKRLSTWEEILDHLHANRRRWRHDVLAVDYLGHLEVQGKDPIEAKKQLFRKAQMLSQDYNSGEGLVIITPLQANKKGWEDADKAEAEAHGVYQSLGAVDWYTQAAQDMSLVLGIWYDGIGDDFKIYSLKSKGRPIPQTLIYINNKTRYLADEPVQAPPNQTASYNGLFAPDRIGEFIPLEMPNE